MGSSRAVDDSSSVGEIQYAVMSALVANAFGSGYWIAVLLAWSPWHSVLWAAALLGGVSLLWDLATSPFPFLLAWATSLGLVSAELLNHRVFLTREEILLQRGVFKPRQVRYPLREVQRVEYSYPTFGKTFGVGDVDILGEGWACTLVAVKNPEQASRRILDLKARAS